MDLDGPKWITRVMPEAMTLNSYFATADIRILNGTSVENSTEYLEITYLLLIG